MVVQSTVIARSGQEIWGMFQDPHNGCRDLYGKEDHRAL